MPGPWGRTTSPRPWISPGALRTRPASTAELRITQRGIGTVARRQLGMGAALDDAAILHDDDFVGVLHGRQAMRDHERRAIAHEADQRLLDPPLGFVVQRRGGFVEY